MWQADAEDKRIAEKLELSDKIDATAKREAFITLKDHKENFRNKPTSNLRAFTEWARRRHVAGPCPFVFHGSNFY